MNRCVVLRDDGKILLLQRSKEKERYAPGVWEFPGGKLEEGQDVSHALEREVTEETGLLVDPISRMAYLDSWLLTDGPYKGLPYVLVVGLGQLAGGRIKLTDEHDVYRWTGIEEAYDFELKPDIRRALSALEPTIKQFVKKRQKNRRGLKP